MDYARRGRGPRLLISIKGWDEGLPGMKIGGKRKFTIPPQATLVFEVELLEVLWWALQPSGPGRFCGIISTHTY